MGIGIQELIIIFFIALLLFGAKRIPEFARNLAKGLREFKRVSQDIKDSIELDEEEHKNKDLPKKTQG